MNKQQLIELLKTDARLLDENAELVPQKVHKFADKTDEKLIQLLFENTETRRHFFMKIGEAFVFKLQEFKFFLDATKLDNSYTLYQNRIGLTAGSRFLRENADIVLNFPFKDCVLEGGQSTDEGTDTYFAYNSNNSNYEKQQGRRKEIFYNQTLAKDEIDRLFEAKAFCNAKQHTANGEEIFIKFRRNETINENRNLAKNTITDNLIIKGNNLIALHSLKEQFQGKVKLIYIDPPYNTGNDSFVYNDSFNHSTWLVFMKNRLEISRELLKNDGIIFVHCDDNEQAYLKVLMDDIFGKQNFETTITNIIKPEGRNYGNIAKSLDYILVYFKNKTDDLLNEIEANKDFDYQDSYGGFNIKELRNGNSAFHIDNRKNLYYPIYVSKEQDLYGFHYVTIKPDENTIFTCFSPKFQNGIQGVWRWGKEKVTNEIHNVMAKKVGNSFGIFQKRRKNTVMPKNYFNEKEFYTSRGSQEMQGLGFSGLFSNPKPEGLLRRIIEMATNEHDIVLDFFGGSGTTAAVAHKLNRQYILVEQMNYIHDLTETRLKKVILGEQGGISKAINWKGGGNFIYLELAKHNAYAQNMIENCETLIDLLQLFDVLYNKYFLHYNINIRKFKEIISKETTFINLPLAIQKAMFCQMLDLNQLYVHVSEMEDIQYGLSDADINLTREFYDLRKI